jgi:hypothetical protein
MKPRLATILLATLFTTFSCKSPEKDGQIIDKAMTPEIDSAAKTGAVPRKSPVTFKSACYHFEKGDSAIFLLNESLIDNGASGFYNTHVGKPGEERGVFNGKFSGDTLFCDYHVRSTGSKKVYDLVFLRIDSTTYLPGTIRLSGSGDTLRMTTPPEVSFDMQAQKLRRCKCEY